MAFEPEWLPAAGARSSSGGARRAGPGSASKAFPRAHRQQPPQGSSDVRAGAPSRCVNLPTDGREHSFRRDQRLTTRPEFQRVFKHGRRSADRCFTLVFCHNSLGHPRLGLAIAKRLVRKASARNRLKRVVRESFRLAASSLPGVDIVVMAGPAAGSANNVALYASLERHWRRLAKLGEAPAQRGKH